MQLRREETKGKMKRLRHVNWSEVMRQTLLKKIREGSRQEVDPDMVEEAIRLMDESRRPRAGFDGTAETRRWRDERK